jgi:hypothetical protein
MNKLAGAILAVGIATLLLYGVSVLWPGTFTANMKFWLGTISGVVGLGLVGVAAVGNRRRGQPYALLVLAAVWFLYIFVEHLQKGP